MEQSRRVTLELIEELRQVQGAPLLSLYLPAVVAGPETRQNRIRFKNGLKRLGEQLDEDRQRRLEGNWRALQELQDDDALWQHTGRGMAWFVGPETFVQVSMPVEPEEIAEVGRRFLLRPLFQALEADQPYQVLTVSQNRVRLFAGDGYGLCEQTLAEAVPSSLFEALGASDADASQQSHTPQTGGGGGNSGVTIFHDQHEGEHSKSRIGRFLDALAGALEETGALGDMPLVLVGPGFEMHMLRDRSDLLTDKLIGMVDGNFDNDGESELHARTWPEVAEWLREQRHGALAQLRESAPEVVATTVEAVVSAAAQGRVESLFVVPDQAVAGRLDGATLEARRAGSEDQADDDLVERAVHEALRNGGRVYPVSRAELGQPDDQPLAAELRY